MANAAPQSIIQAKFIKGIDGVSPVNDIQEGCVDDVVNMVPNPVGELVSREGSRTVAGLIPLRILKVTYSTAAEQNIAIQIASGPNFASLQSRPILIRGRTSTSNSGNLGDFVNNAITTKIYSHFHVLSASEVQGGTNKAFPNAALSIVGCVRRTSFADTSALAATSVDSYVVNGSTFEGTLTLQGDPSTTYSAWTVGIAESVGSVYHFDLFAVDSQEAAQTFSIPHGTHGVTGRDFIVKAFQIVAGDYVLIELDEVTVAVNGDVTVTLRQNTGSTQDYVVAVIASESYAQGTLSLGGVSELGPLSGFGTPYIIAACYYSDAGLWKECKPDEIEYDAVTDETTFRFNNMNGVAATSIRVCYIKYGATSDTLFVDGGQIGAGFTDAAPEMCLYGIDAAELGDSFAPNRLVDVYRDQLAESPVTIHMHTPFMESTLPAATSAVSLGVLVDTGSDAQHYIGPVLATAAQRTEGNVIHPAARFGLIENVLTSISGSNILVTLPMPGYSVVGTPITVGDSLTLQRMFRAELNGVHEILSFTLEANQIVFTVANPAPLLGSLLAGMGGQAGLFTNRFHTFAGTVCPFLLGDSLTAANNVDDFGTFAGFDGVDLLVECAVAVVLPYNQTISARRTASVIPLTTNFLVQGDSVVVNGQYRQALSARVGSDLTVDSTVGDGTEAVITITGEVYTSFNRGSKFLLLNAGDFTGELTCSNVMWNGTETTVFVEHAHVGTVSGGTVWGASIEVAPIEVSSAITVDLVSRWHALEGLRDATVSNRAPDSTALILTADEMMSSSGFGGNLYAVSPNNRPIAMDPFGSRDTGLPDWNPMVGVAVTDVGSGIYIAPQTITVIQPNGVKGRTFTVALGDEVKAAKGQRYAVWSGLGRFGDVQVVSTANDGVNGYITASPVSGEIDDSATSLRLVVTYRYYARLSHVDANGSRLLGPTCGLADAEVNLSSSVGVLVNLIEPPHVGAMDYGRGVYIDLFRTAAITASSDQAVSSRYYKVASLLCNFTGSPYQTFLDTLSDDFLTDIDLDTQACSTSMMSIESGQLFLPPPPCKTLTSLAGYVVYGNLTAMPTLDLRLFSAGGIALTDFAGASVVLTSGTARTFKATTTTKTITAISRSGTTVSITFASATNLNQGDWIFVRHNPPGTGTPGYIANGWYQIATLIGNTITVVAPGASGTFASVSSDTRIFYTTSGSVPLPMEALNLQEGTWTPAGLFLRRLAAAINCVEVQLGLSNFSARAGDGILPNHILIKSVNPLATAVITAASPIKLDVGGTYKVSPATVNFDTRLFPSRLAISGKGYPEVCYGYDKDPVALAKGADTAFVDVNPADGDEIIAIRPLLAEAIFSDVRKQQTLVVFKRRSIHAVDILKRVTGEAEYSQQITSYGVGCCSPTAVAHTEHGIIFAGNDSIYLLDSKLILTRIGEIVERHLDFLAYPADETVSARGGEKAYVSWGTDVVVTKPWPKEEQWGRWEMPRIVYGWSTLMTRALAGCQGRVLEFRKELTADDSVNFTHQVTLKCVDFGDCSITKDLNELFIDANVAPTVEFATEMRNSWQPCTLANPTLSTVDDKLGAVEKPVRSVLRYACPAKKFQTLQVRVTSEQYFKFARVVYRVKGNREKGTGEASD